MEVLGIESCILPKSNQPDWQKQRSIRPIYVDNVMDAYNTFQLISLNTDSEIKNKKALEK